MTRVFFLGFAVLAVACGGHSQSQSVCDSQVPPPAACMTTCDASPGAPNSCPPGYHCSPDGKCDALCTPAGNQCPSRETCSSDGNCVPCTGLACDVTACDEKRMLPTTISGTVYAPNGTLPLYGVSVYVPNSDPGPFTPGVQCGSCAAPLPGDPIAQTTTDENGNFSLRNVPDGANIPLVITIGKWRRQITIAKIAACATQSVDPVDTTLPKSRDDLTPNTTSVDLPQIAISTGSSDALECLVRRLGIADKEITTDGQGGKIHLFADLGAGGGVGVKSFDTTFGRGTGDFNNSQTLWGTSTDPGKLNDYDIVILSCEGAQHAETKLQQAMDHLKAYADLGGRVFLSHWHNIWIEGATQAGNGTKPAIWPTIATFGGSTDLPNGTVDTIDETNNPKGVSFANWMLNVGGSIVMGSNVRGAVPIQDRTGKQTCTMVDETKAKQWVYWQNGATQLPQNFQFTTPNEAADDQRCGKVVFSDMHVSAAPIAVTAGGPFLPYPSSCGDAPPNPPAMLTAQEKALAFMFFDISSCVGPI